MPQKQIIKFALEKTFFLYPATQELSLTFKMYSVVEGKIEMKRQASNTKNRILRLC